MEFTRRDLGKIALVSLPLSRAFGAKTIDSKIGGVQIGAIRYSFSSIASPDPEDIIKAYVDVGLGEAELMSNHCEALAGAAATAQFRRRRRWRPAGGPPPRHPVSQPPAGRPLRWLQRSVEAAGPRLLPISRPNGKLSGRN